MAKDKEHIENPFDVANSPVLLMALPGFAAGRSVRTEAAAFP